MKSVSVIFFLVNLPIEKTKHDFKTNRHIFGQGTHSISENKYVRFGSN